MDGNPNDPNIWHSGSGSMPEWWKYDLGSGVTKTVKSFKILSSYDTGGWSIKDFKLQGSNNDSDWTDIGTFQYPGGGSGQANPQSFSCSGNTTAYRYYRYYITSVWRSNNYCIIAETEMFE